MSKVDDYILELPKTTQEIAIHLRNIILQCHPAIKESFKYNCPFYDYKKNICYFYFKNDSIILGLVQGVKLAQNNPILVGNQKQIRHIVIIKMDDELENEIRFVLQEAILLNDELFKTNKSQWK